MGLRLQKYGTGSSVVSRRWMDKPVSICSATTVVSSAWRVGDLKDGTRHALGQRIQFIGVYRRSSAAKPECRPNAQALKNNSLAADQRRFWPEPRDSAFMYRFFRALDRKSTRLNSSHLGISY